MKLVPTQYFLTKGIGIHAEEHRAYVEAVRDAGLERCNLVRASGVLPPGCRRISREEGLAALEAGMITFAVQAVSVARTPGQSATAAIAVACCGTGAEAGYFSAVDGAGREAPDVQQDAEERAIGELLEHWGLETEPRQFVRRGQKEYQYEEQQFTVDSLIASARSHEDHLSTIVLVMAVFLFE